MAESLILDPAAVAEDRVEIDITRFVGDRGPDFGEAAIQAYMAEGSMGSRPVDFAVPNRTVTIPLNLFETSDYTFDDIRTALQAKVALWQREGGIVARGNTRVGTVYADVVNASLKLGGSGLQAHGFIDADAVLTLECLPDWWGDEVTRDVHTSADGESELVFVEEGIEGNYPARARLAVTDLSGDDQSGVICAVRSRHYSTAPTAEVVYEAEDLGPAGSSTVSANGTASGGEAVVNSAVDDTWATVLSTDIASASMLTHTGSYRAWARVASSDAVSLRLVWDVGDLTWPTRNAQVDFAPGDADWYLVDLGEVRIDRVPVGEHRWKGLIEARTDAAPIDLWIDKVWFCNVDEGYTRLQAVEESLPAPDTTIAFDASSSSSAGSGNLSWTHTPVGTPKGVAVLIMQDDTLDDQVTSVTYGGTVMSEMRLSPYTKGVASNGKLYGYFLGEGIPTGPQTIAVNVSAGSPKRAAAITVTSNSETTAVEDTSTVSQVSGDAEMSLTTDYETVVFAMSMAHKNDPGDFNPGANYTQVLEYDWGTKVGLWERGTANFEAGVVTVDFTYLGSQAANAGFAVAIRAEPLEPGELHDAVIYANGTVELRYDGHFRASDDGAAYGPVPYAVGDLMRVPPSGLEGRPVEFLVKTTRGDLDSDPDWSIDPIAAQLIYRPTFLYLPGDTGS